MVPSVLTVQVRVLLSLVVIVIILSPEVSKPFAANFKPSYAPAVQVLKPAGAKVLSSVTLLARVYSVEPTLTLLILLIKVVSSVPIGLLNLSS